MRDILNMQETLAVQVAAAGAVKKVVEVLGPEHQGKGGYFRLFLLEPFMGYLGLIELMAGWVGGNTNMGNIGKYYIVSMEKAIRLANNHLIHGHVSSQQSRGVIYIPPGQKEIMVYGGAIIVTCDMPRLGKKDVTLLSTISGLPEEGDEASMALGARNFPWDIEPAQVDNILTISKNSLADQVFGAF